MEKVYVLLFILFVLSQIAERISNFIKLKFSDSKLLIKANDWWLKRVFSFGNTKLKSTDQQEEKEREFRILKINVTIGILISFLFRTDLFCILQYITEPTSHMGWSTFTADLKAYEPTEKSGLNVVLFILSTILGCMITGVFISFGSKFWHDLLDLVLQVKNYRDMLTKKGIEDQTRQFATLEYDKQEAIMTSAINENFDTWLNIYPNIIGASSGLKKTGNTELPVNAIVFKVDGKLPASTLDRSQKIPKFIDYKGVKIPTDVIEYLPPKALIRYPGDEQPPSLLGVNVSLQAYNNFGTVGLRVKKTGDLRPYLLSCFHVLCTFKLREANDISRGLECHNLIPQPPYYINIPSTNYLDQHAGKETRLKGYLTDGVLSEEVDAAIALVTDGQLENQTYYYDNKSIAVSGELSYDLLAKGLNVHTFGCVSGHRPAQILDVMAQKTVVKIDDRFKFTFNKLIELSCPAIDGDSGAPVLTDHGKVVGILIAGNDEKSFVVPFPFIKNALHITI